MEAVVQPFLTSDRSGPSEIERLRAVLRGQPLARTLLDGIPDGAMILDANRQTVLANRALLERLGLAGEDAVVGKRPGEAFGCVHAKLEPNGCGTTRFCRYCGAAQVLAECHMTRRAAEECRIITELESETDAIDLMVWGTPFELAGEGLTLFAVADLTHAKRRQVLERIFLHDFANSLNALGGYVDLLDTAAMSAENRDLVIQAAELVSLLELDIQCQRQLTQAESGSLTVAVAPIGSRQFLAELRDLAGKLDAARGKTLAVAPESAALILSSDASLLLRVMLNLAKNALEAAAAGETVTIGCAAMADGAAFWVHNQAWLETSVQLQLFKRSFSTKGPGRGIGLYSVRLLTERYLGGRVCFSSSPDAGTVFRVELPLIPPQAGEVVGSA